MIKRKRRTKITTLELFILLKPLHKYSMSVTASVATPTRPTLTQFIVSEIYMYEP